MVGAYVLLNRQDGQLAVPLSRPSAKLRRDSNGSSSMKASEETVRKLDRLHLFDCLRANKAMAAWGVEARVPFLDVECLDVATAIDPAEKMPRKAQGRIEKQVLRDAFAGILPEEVTNRPKEQFSDGVGYGWIDPLKANAAIRVSDSEMRQAHVRFPHNTPDTKEAYWRRSDQPSTVPERRSAAPHGTIRALVSNCRKLAYVASPATISPLRVT